MKLIIHELAEIELNEAAEFYAILLAREDMKHENRHRLGMKFIP
jgi:hypothetical protein